MEIKTFSFNRYILLLKKQYKENFRRRLVIMAISIVLMALGFMLIEWISNIIKADLGQEQIMEIAKTGLKSFFLMVVPITLVSLMIAYHSAHSMPFMKNKIRQRAYMLLPASSLEKYATAIVMSFFLTLVEWLITFFIADLVQFLYSGKFVINSIFNIAPFLTFVGNSVSSDMALYFGDYSIYLFIISLLFSSAWFTMSATLFRKHPFLLGYLCYFVGSQIFGLIINLYNNSFAMGNLDEFDIIGTVNIHLVMSLVLIPTFWIWSYYRMKRVEA